MKLPTTVLISAISVGILIAAAFITCLLLPEYQFAVDRSLKVDLMNTWMVRVVVGMSRFP